VTKEDAAAAADDDDDDELRSNSFNLMNTICRQELT
jgi:hypothetical protein